MDAYLNLTYWLFEPNFWLITGVVSVIADIFLGSFFLLPIGVSALIMAALVYFDASQFWEVEIFSSWRVVMLCFAVLSVASIFLIQIFIRSRRKEEKDINQY